MPSNPHDPSHVTTVAIEMEPGWTYFKISGPKPEPTRNEFFLRRALEDWFAERPTLVTSKATAFVHHGEMLGIHVWYDEVNADLERRRTATPVEFGIDVHSQVAARHSKEYIEAVITDALNTLLSYQDRGDTLAMVNPRRIAVTLNERARRGRVVPVEFIEPVIESGMKNRLQAWLAAPSRTFFVMHIAGSRLSSDR